MKVLQVITDDDRRGAQLFALDLGAALAKLGETVDTVALARSAGALDVECLGGRRRSVRTIAALRARLATADVAVAHGSTTLPVGVLAARGTRTPLVYRQISDPSFWAASWGRRLRTAGFLRRCDHVVSLSPDAKEVVTRHYWLDDDHVTVIPNGVSAEVFIPPTTEQRMRSRRSLGVDSEFAVSFVGALVPEKGTDLAIRAVAGLEGVRLLVAGDGPERESLRALAAELDADVELLGNVARPVDVLHASDALVLPSRGGDSMPASLIEACFVGVPIVATSVGSIDEIIVDDRTGLLLDASDPRLLRDAIACLRDDPTRRETMATAARSAALERFEIGVVARQWQEALRRLAR
jgi:glycosyltransferase involved in cell wall biosynthesis